MKKKANIASGIAIVEVNIPQPSDLFPLAKETAITTIASTGVKHISESPKDEFSEYSDSSKEGV